MLALIVALSVVWMLINGAQDAPNCVTTTIVTGSLSPRRALAYAAAMNVAGVFFSVVAMSYLHTSLLTLLGLPEIIMSSGNATGGVLVVTLCVSTLWCALAWWRGVPISGWSATLAALAGALFAATGIGAGTSTVLGFFTPIVLSPLLGFIVSFGLAKAIRALRSERLITLGTLRGSQTVTAGLVAFGHGLSNGRIPMGFIVAAYMVYGSVPPGQDKLASHDFWTHTAHGTSVPLWVMVIVAVSLGAGTMLGGKEIIRTLGRRLTDLTVGQGLAAETSTALLMYVAATGFHLPVSSSQTIAGSIVGSAVAVSRKAVAWGECARIFAWWVATPLSSALAAAVVMAATGTLL